MLPDEFCGGGESLVRNLLLGHRQAKALGGVSKTGYSPFGWGQLSQMPQIYTGFGIPFAAFYRGVNTDIAPNSKFRWQSPDGTEIGMDARDLGPHLRFQEIRHGDQRQNRDDGDNDQ